MRPRISIRGCVRPSVRRSVGPLVRDAFVKIAENGVMQDGDASYVVYTALLENFSLTPMSQILLLDILYNVFVKKKFKK